MNDWLDPLNKLLFHEAFKAKKQQVITRDGRLFKLDYTREKGKVHIAPIPTPMHPSPFVPRGLFDLKVVTSEDWISN